MTNINIRTSQENKIVKVRQMKNNKVNLSIYALILQLYVEKHSECSFKQ